MKINLYQLQKRLFEPVDIASIVIFRILFGAILVWEVIRYFEKDWIRLYYIVRDYYFKYFGFEWVHPWPGDWMYILFIAVGILAFCFMIGLFYRITAWLLFLGFTYWFLLDQTRYLNHLYLTSLLLFLMACIPAHRAKSCDVLLQPKLRSTTIPAWSLWILRIQLAIVYLYGGIAKINGDWLRGEPIRKWLAVRDDYPLIGGLLETEMATWFFAYGGLCFDLLIVPLFLWRKTRLLALFLSLFFHLTNKMIFNIGIFPILMLAATTLLFPPDWPRKVLLFFMPEPHTKPTTLSANHRRFVTGFVVVYLAIQIIIPMRQFFYPGNVNWTEEGHRFAWRMKLRQKRATADFYATDPKTGETWLLDNREYLSTTQNEKVGRNPDMTLQFAHFLAEELKKDGYEEIEIRADIQASLNGREYQQFIDPTVDLVKEKRSLWPTSWILPLEKDLP